MRGSTSRAVTAGRNIICRASGTTTGNVYVTLEAACAAAAAAGPGTEVLVDGDVTTAGVPIDVSGVKVRGLNGGTTPTITCVDGTSFTDSYADWYFENVAISFSGAARPLMTVPDTNGTITLGPYASIATTPAATKGIVETTNGAVYLDALSNNTIHGSSGHQAIKLGAGASLRLTIGNYGALDANSITGGPTGAATITDLSKATGTAHASISQTQTGLDTPVFD